jgi:uncharacterized protein YeaO (DUF488 family)
MRSSHGVRVARVYDQPGPDDGARVLVDRLWPRGLAKEAAALDDWCKQIAPSNELRTWFGHDPARYDEFVVRYHDELDDPGRAAALTALRATCATRDVTLLTATKLVDISHAAVLAELLTARQPRS